LLQVKNNEITVHFGFPNPSCVRVQLRSGRPASAARTSYST
jgi:hypothetical protein